MGFADISGSQPAGLARHRRCVHEYGVPDSAMALRDLTPRPSIHNSRHRQSRAPRYEATRCVPDAPAGYR